jgi:DNA-binding winged helix-turn-helix (wHTH) protein/tetratricopeptide (TPR) repeat protein
VIASLSELARDRVLPRDGSLLKAQHTVILSFGEFVFDPDRHLLRKNGELIKVDPQQLSLLACLVASPGHLLTREEILNQVWEGRAVTSSALSVAVAKLRKVLGGEGKQTYIENRYGRGYRFVMPVHMADASLELPASSDDGVGATPLVGREDVCAQLLQTLESCRAGHGTMCALIGEAGIGKTRVAEVLEDAARGRGMRTAWARFSMAEGAPPLFPFVQALRELSLEGFADEVLTTMESLAQSQAERTPLSAAGPLSAELIHGSSALLHRMLDQISQCLSRVSQRSPLLLIVDDVHWADTASLRLLAYLLNDLPRMHLFLLIALRASDVPPSDPRHAELVRILSHRRCERHELTRLAEQDVARYVSSQFEYASPDLSQAVFVRSEGNPFYMVELLRPFMGHGHGQSAPSSAELRFPGLALDAMRKRLTTLPEDSRAALSVAAVIGHDFDLGLLSRVTGHNADRLLEELDSSLANETIVASLQAPGSFAFAHDLIREVLYSELSASERCRLHLQVGQALEERRSAGMQVPSVGLAHHFLAALPYGELAYAIAHARAAASAAMRVAAYADARVLLLRALEATKVGADADPATLSALWLELALVERAMGHPETKEHLRQGVRLARERQLGALLTTAGQLLSPAPGLVARADAVEVLEAALEALPPTAAEQRALALTHLAWTPPNCMSQRRVQALLAEAEQLIAGRDAPDATAALRDGRLFFLAGPATQAQAEVVAQAIEQDLRAKNELTRSTRALTLASNRWMMATQRGDTRAMQLHIEQYRQALMPLHNAELDWHWQRIELVMRMNSGEFGGVAEDIERLRAQADRLRLQARHSLWARDLGQLLFWAGDPTQLVSLIKPSLTLATTDLPIGRSYKLRALAEMGLMAEARQALATVTEDWLRDLPQDRDYLAVMAQISVCVIAAGSREHAKVLYELLLPFAHFYAASITFECMGSISYFLGMLARTLGDAQAALAHLQHATAANERVELSACALQAQVELARLLLTERSVVDVERARLLLSAARPVAQHRGLVNVLRSIDEHSRVQPLRARG